MLSMGCEMDKGARWCRREEEMVAWRRDLWKVFAKNQLRTCSTARKAGRLRLEGNREASFSYLKTIEKKSEVPLMLVIGIALYAIFNVTVISPSWVSGRADVVMHGWEQPTHTTGPWLRTTLFQG